MNRSKCTAIVLAAGQGKRMGANVQKQYMELKGKPVLYYSLRAFEDSPIIDEIILVTGKGQEVYCENEIVIPYGFTKVHTIIEGGAERYHSVFNGLQCIEGEGYVFIHDGARPFIEEEILQRVYEGVQLHQACAVGMPVKDTIKVVNEHQFAEKTPDREMLWLIQTPQVFATSIIKDAYEKLMREPYIQVTDDAMVVEQMIGYKVKLIKGSYENIKITTPEDILIAEVFVEKKKKNLRDKY